MAALTGAHLLMRCLKLEGIRRIFTIVGDTILPLCDAAVDEGIQLIDTRHEAAAMGMADAWCRITGEPSVVMVTGGPGFANAISGLPNVYTSESPVVFIAGASELPEHGMLSFQEVDQIAITRPMTKGSWMIHHRSRIADMTAAAFRAALSGRPGPVHLSIPLDIQEEPATDDDLPSYRPGQYSHRGRNPADPRLIDDAAALLRRAERPVVIAGNTARYSVTPAEMRAFSEATGLPVFTVEQARGLLPDSHPLCFGYADAALNHSARHFREADAVLLLGKRLDHRYRYGMAPYFAPGVELIQADQEPGDIGRNRGVALPILGHLGTVVGQLTEAAQGRSWRNLSSWTQTLGNSRRAQLRAMEDLATDHTPLHPMSVFKEMKPFIDDDSVLIFDGGDFVQWGRSYLGASKLGHWLRLGPLSHLGFGLPYALSARLAKPASKVFLFMGDGSLGFYAMEYDTALRHNLPFTTVLGNDATWSIDKHFQLAYYGRAVATDLRPLRYDRVVSAIGGHGEHVSTIGELAPALRRALESGQPSLIDVATRPAQSPLADAMIARRLGVKG